VRAPAVDGRTAETLLAFLANKPGRPRRDVILVSGARARQKIVRLRGVEPASLRRRLGAPADAIA
jgi:uncharacterized protein YggU (UPF0235/DUF167 family)